MSAETTVYSVLSAAAGVTALAGSRIYPDELPEDYDLPAVVFGRTATELVATIHGTLAARRARIQVNCWAKERLDAETLADAVQAALLAAGHLPAARESDLEPQTGACVSALDFNIIE
jgi:hypothetical protein